MAAPLDLNLTPQQILNETVVAAATEGLSRAAFQDLFHKNISGYYNLQKHEVNLSWDFDNGSVGLTVGKDSFMLTGGFTF